MIFENRKGQLVFNDYGPSAIQPWIALEKASGQMCLSQSSVVSEMTHHPGHGWQLKSHVFLPGDKEWQSAAAAGALSIANGATVAANHSEENSFARLALPGVVYSSGTQVSGSPKITAKVPAGVDWGTLELTADALALPPPDTAGDDVKMLRRYNFDGIQPWDSLMFDHYVPASVLSSRGTFATDYFAGPAGVDRAAIDDPSKEGKGWYAMKLRGDGKAYVYEQLEDNSWKLRTEFWWNTDPGVVPGLLVVIEVRPRMWKREDGGFVGDRLLFIPRSLTTSHAISALGERYWDAKVLEQRLATGNLPLYVVPRLSDKATTPCLIRIDTASDCRASFMAWREVYYDSGYLLDDGLNLDQPVTQDNDLFVYVKGVVPDGTTVTVDAYDDEGNPLTQTSGPTVINTKLGQTVACGFHPNVLTDGTPMRQMRVKISATASSDKFRSPTIFGYEVDRAPVYGNENPLDLVVCPAAVTAPGLPKNVISSVSINPQETDPGGENAQFEVVDLTGDLAFLGERNMVPVLYRVTDNPDDPEPTYAHLFRGYVLQANGTQFRTDGQAYPAANATRWNLQCVGEWSRTTETLVPRMKAWGSNPATGAPWRVTDVIRFAAELTYPPEMIDVPDIDVPLLTDDPNAYTMEPNARSIDFMTTLSQDYLGAYMLYDEAAGERGMLRMLQQKHAPYHNLATFEIQHPTELHGDGVPRLPHWAAAYPTTTVDGQEVLSAPIFAGTYQHYLEKAEGNCVTVFGSAIGNDANAAGVSGGGLLVQTAINVSSYNFLGLSPSDPGYPDGSSPEFYNRIVPIRVVDWKLGSQEAVDWKCRRVFEKACFARFHLMFEAPLILVTDVTDPLQQRPRRLRFYDAVQVRQPDGSLKQFLVVSCSPSFRKDGMMTARYHLITQSNIDTIGAIDGQASLLKALQKAMGRSTGANWQYGSPTGVQQKQGEHLANAIMGLPTPSSLPIQDLDNTSGTFGQFINMAAFDAIPHA